jgi:RNA polymerase sigma-70 factor (ECF subfamily)
VGSDSRGGGRRPRPRAAVPALSKLTGPQREVITLAYFGGHTHRQVAAILGAPPGTVKGRIREALIGLRLAMTSDD